jgi:hypothetical protein
MFMDLELLFAYSNINFTEKQKENLVTLYDTLWSSGLLSAVLNAIPEDERNFMYEGLENSLKALYSYQNSLMGIFENLKNNYENVNFDLESIVSLLQSGELDELKSLVANLN